MQEDAHLAVVAARVPKRILDLSLTPIGGVSEVVVAHGDANVSLNLDLVVVIDHLAPALATVDREASILFVAAVDDAAADEVGHGLLARRAELEVGGLGRLEHHIRVAVRVELARRIRRCLDVVALALVRGGDLLNAVRPLLLHSEHLLLRNGRELGRRLHVRHGRVVQEDAHLAVESTLAVAKRVLDLGLLTGSCTGEVVGAHRDARPADDLDLVIVEDHLAPALAAVDREAAILRDAVLDGLGTDKVRHGVRARWAEGHLGGLGRLEENIRMAIAVQLARGIRGSLHVVAAVQVRL